MDNTDTAAKKKTEFEKQYGKIGEIYSENMWMTRFGFYCTGFDVGYNARANQGVNESLLCDICETKNCCDAYDNGGRMIIGSDCEGFVAKKEKLNKHCAD